MQPTRQTPSAATPTTRPAIVVHHLGHAEAVLAAAQATGIEVRIESAANAAGHGGALWFAEVVAAAQKMHPEARFEAVLDCGTGPGRALGAIREFAHHDAPLAVRTRTSARVRAKIAAIAGSAGVPLHEGPPGRALDLLDMTEPRAAVAAYLSEHSVRAGRSASRNKSKVRSRAKTGPASRLQKA